MIFTNKTAKQYVINWIFEKLESSYDVISYQHNILQELKILTLDDFCLVSLDDDGFKYELCYYDHSGIIRPIKASKYKQIATLLYKSEKLKAFL